MTNCTVCGKEVEDVSKFPTLTKQPACSLKCCEIATEMHILETKLRRLQSESSDRKITQALKDEMQSVLDLFEDDAVDYSGTSHRVPSSYQELRKLKDTLIELVKDWYDND